MPEVKPIAFMGSKNRVFALAAASFLCACTPRGSTALAHEEAWVTSLDTVALVEKPGPEGKVRGLAHLGEVFAPSPERAPDMKVNGDETEGYPAAAGVFIGLHKERSGPLFLGPEGSFARTTVVTTDALCALPAAPPAGAAPRTDCAASMRRVALPEARTLGYLPCLATACPVVVASHLAGGAAPSILAVDGLSSVRGLATPAGFRLVLQETVVRPGQGPATRYEIRDLGAGLPVRLVIEGSATTSQPDGSLFVRLVQVRFGSTEAHVVGTERRAPNASAVGVTQKVEQRIPYPR